MKRKMLWYAFLALALLLTACGGAVPAAPATQAPASNTTPQKGGRNDRRLQGRSRYT